MLRPIPVKARMDAHDFRWVAVMPSLWFTSYSILFHFIQISEGVNHSSEISGNPYQKREISYAECYLERLDSNISFSFLLDPILFHLIFFHLVLFYFIPFQPASGHVDESLHHRDVQRHIHQPDDVSSTPCDKIKPLQCTPGGSTTYGG